MLATFWQPAALLHGFHGDFFLIVAAGLRRGLRVHDPSPSVDSGYSARQQPELSIRPSIHPSIHPSLGIPATIFVDLGAVCRVLAFTWTYSPWRPACSTSPCPSVLCRDFLESEPGLGFPRVSCRAGSPHPVPGTGDVYRM